MGWRQKIASVVPEFAFEQRRSDAQTPRRGSMALGAGRLQKSLDVVPQVLIDDSRMQTWKGLLLVADQAKINWVGEKLVDLTPAEGVPGQCQRKLGCEWQSVILASAHDKTFPISLLQNVA